MHGRSCAKTSIRLSSFARTPTFMSRKVEPYPGPAPVCVRWERRIFGVSLTVCMLCRVQVGRPIACCLRDGGTAYALTRGRGNRTFRSSGTCANATPALREWERRSFHCRKRETPPSDWSSLASKGGTQPLPTLSHSKEEEWPPLFVSPSLVPPLPADLHRLDKILQVALCDSLRSFFAKGEGAEASCDVALRIRMLTWRLGTVSSKL